MSYPSLSESYWMDFSPATPEWVCAECVQEVFPEDGLAFCFRCGDGSAVVAGSVWEAATGESWY